MRQFHGEWLHFGDYADISKVNVPTYKTSLNAEYQESAYRFFDNIFTQGLGVKDMLLSTKGYYGAGMATFYGLTAPAAGSYTQADLGAKRVGFFSQLPYLTLNGHNDEPSSILRGVTLNLDVLCATLGPPAAVIPPIPPLMPGQTNRQRIDTLTGTCGQSCHNDMINPLGFAFEHFDGMGNWRDTENGGLTIDSSGSYTFADGVTRTWNDAAGLMQVLASTPQTYTCFAKKLASYGLQRDHHAERHAAAELADVGGHGDRHQLGEAAHHPARQKRRVPHPRRSLVMRDPKDIARPVVDRESGKLQGFRLSKEGARKNAINRRAFLRGAGTVAIGLPFLEGLPERSAWAASSPPVFTMFIVGSCGVEGTSFLPDATGALTTAGLAGMTTKAVSALSAHAANLTMLKHINWPQNVKSCGHAEGLCQAITAIVPGATGHGAYAGGLSADVAIGKAVNPTGVDPIILYSAAKGAYIADRISWRGAGADQLRTGDQNPYTLFTKLMGLHHQHRHRHDDDDRSRRRGAGGDAEERQRPGEGRAEQPDEQHGVELG